MDSLHSLLFYASGAVAVAGALAAALLPGRRRAYALAVFGIGLAILYADLGAAFAGAVALVAYFGAAALLAITYAGVRAVEPEPAGLAGQVAGVLAAVVFAGLAYVAFRSDYFSNGYSGGGTFGAAAVGRLLIARDALGLEAAAAAVLLAAAGFGLAARVVRPVSRELERRRR